MQSNSFFKVRDKFTNKDFAVAVDPILYIENMSVDSIPYCGSKIHYNLPQSEIDYVYNEVGEIEEKFYKLNRPICHSRLRDGRHILLNPAYILKLNRCDTSDSSESFIEVIFTTGDTLILNDSLDNFFSCILGIFRGTII